MRLWGSGAGFSNHPSRLFVEDVLRRTRADFWTSNFLTVTVRENKFKERVQSVGPLTFRFLDYCVRQWPTKIDI